MTAHAQPLLHYLQHLVGPANTAPDDDAALVQRFAFQKDEAAFTALLTRHGPMVYGVCRRVLHDDQEAEDAFQAVFLLLARKAGTLRHPETLAAWLYGVARRLALMALRSSYRRRQRERKSAADALAAIHPLDELSARELLLIVDEEMARLPERYRLPLILCGLEGRSQAEAARLLGWTDGSVKGRLERGRKRLHARLNRRGLTLGASLLAMESMASATVSAALRQATVQRALTFAAGSTEGIVASILALAESGAASMAMTKVKAGLLLLLALGFAGGTGVWAYSLRSDQQAEERENNREAKSHTPTPASGKRALTDVYGDPLPPGALARMGTMRWRHIGTIISVAYSPDGKIIATGEANEGPIILWDAASGKELHRLEEEPGVRGCFAFSPDSKQLALAKWGSWVGLWDVATGKQVRRLKAQSGGAGGRVAYSADGKILAASLGQEVVLFDVQTGAERRRLKGHPEFVQSIAFSPDGKTLAAGGRSKTIVLWDTAMGNILHRLDGHEKEVPCVAFSADGKTLASASHDRTARLWDVATGREQRRFVHEHKYNDDAIQTVHFVPGHPWLIAGGMRFIRIWDLSTGKEVRRFPGHFCLCDCPTALSPDSTKLATRGPEQGQIAVWELTTGKNLCESRGHQRAIGSVAFSPDGKALATGSWDETIRLWDSTNGKELRRFRMSFGVHVAFMPDGKTLAGGSDNGFVCFWDAVNGKELRRFPTHKGGLGCMALAVDGQTCVTSGVNRGEFDDKSKTLVTKTVDPVIRRWRVDTGAEIGRFEGLAKAAGVLALAPDGKTMVSATDNTATLWDIASSKQIRAFHIQQDNWLACIAYSPDGKTVAAAGADRVIHLWDAATGEEIRRFGGHDNSVHAVCFSPDGRMLASGGYDRSVRLWEIATGQERQRFLGHRHAIFALDFSRDGRRLASAGMDATALVWDVMGRFNAERDKAARLSEKDLTRLWTELGDEKSAAQAYQAERLLLRDPAATMRLFQEQLHPVPAIERARIDRWIADLDSAEFEVREKAVGELERQGEAVEGALRKLIEGRPSLEVRQRVKLLLEKLSGANRLRKLRAVEVLEYSDTAESHHLLQTLAGGAADARLTQEAKASLARRAARP